MSKVRVVLNDAPVHCIDVNDGRGERVLRIRPFKDGVTIKTYDAPAASLTAEELRDLADALSRVATQGRPAPTPE